MSEHDFEPIPDVPLLRKVVDWATVEAEKPESKREWVQRAWRTLRRKSPQREVTACGTAYCMAGYVASLDGVWAANSRSSNYSDYLLAEHTENGIDYEPGFTRDGRNRALIHARERARNRLGITDDEAYVLFGGGNSIEDIRRIAGRIAERVGEKL